MKKIIIYLLFLSIFLNESVSASTSIFGFGANSMGSYQYPYSAAARGRGGFSMAVIDSVGLNQIHLEKLIKTVGI